MSHEGEEVAYIPAMIVSFICNHFRLLGYIVKTNKIILIRVEINETVEWYLLPGRTTKRNKSITALPITYILICEALNCYHCLTIITCYAKIRKKQLHPYQNSLGLILLVTNLLKNFHLEISSKIFCRTSHIKMH